MIVCYSMLNYFLPLIILYNAENHTNNTDFDVFLHRIENYFVTLAVVEDTHIRENSNIIWFSSRLIVLWLAPKILSFEKVQINLAFYSLNRIFNFVEDTHVRKNSNKFGFLLT